MPDTVVELTDQDDDTMNALGLDEDEFSPFLVYLADVTGESLGSATDSTVEEFRESFQGTWDSAADWASEYIDVLVDVPESLQGYIDYAAYARDAELSGAYSFIEVGYRSVYVYRSI